MKQIYHNWISPLGTSVMVAIMAWVGFLWSFVEGTAYFFEHYYWVAWLKWNFWVIFWIGFIGSIVIVVYSAIRQRSVKISNTDITIRIKVGNALSKKFKGALVIGSNATFDTSLENEVISTKSMQGQYTIQYFGTNVTRLDREIDIALGETEPSRELNETEKPYGKLMEYTMGTVAKVRVREHTAYLVALSRLNKNKVAESNMNDYLDALGTMWNEIRYKGTQEAIVCPLIGTGFTRLSLTRMEAIKYLVRSFVTAAAEGKFAESLTIVIYPPDLKDIDLPDLRQFLICECKHRQVSVHSQDSSPVGTVA